VPQASAVLPGISDAEAIAIPADRINMIKFSSRDDEVYRKVCGHLILLGRDAPGKVSARWEQYDRSVHGMLSRIYMMFVGPNVNKLKGMRTQTFAFHSASLEFPRPKSSLEERKS
jgi:hypothetical protein